MRYRLELFSQAYDVDIEIDSNGNIKRIAINGQWFESTVFQENKLPLEITKSNEDNEEYILKYNSQEFNLHLKLLKTIRSENVVSQDRSSSFSKEILTSEGYIIAPMAGKIIEINCQQNDNVTKGQILLVFEAMKMENEIISPVSGTIIRVAVEVGSIFAVNQILLEIQK